MGMAWYEKGKMEGWFGLTIHQQSHLRKHSTAHGKLEIGEPSNSGNEDCAFLYFLFRKWNDNKCDDGGNLGPYVLCQKIP